MKNCLLSLIIVAAGLCAGCGAGKSNSNNSAANNAQSGNANAKSETKTIASETDKPPINKDAFDFYMEIKESSEPKSFVGRSVTITELDLKEIESSTLRLGYSWYFFVDCEGSFSDYLAVKDVVAKRAKDKPVQATIKGVIKEASKETVKLEPCVMTDIKK